MFISLRLSIAIVALILSDSTAAFTDRAATGSSTVMTSAQPTGSDKPVAAKLANETLSAKLVRYAELRGEKDMVVANLIVLRRPIPEEVRTTLGPTPPRGDLTPSEKWAYKPEPLLIAGQVYDHAFKQLLWLPADKPKKAGDVGCPASVLMLSTALCGSSSICTSCPALRKTVAAAPAKSWSSSMIITRAVLCLFPLFPA